MSTTKVGGLTVEVKDGTWEIKDSSGKSLATGTSTEDLIASLDKHKTGPSADRHYERVGQQFTDAKRALATVKADIADAEKHYGPKAGRRRKTRRRSSSRKTRRSRK